MNNNLVGKWAIDPSHSNVTFSVRHLMISKVRGSFGEFKGEANIAENLAESSLIGLIDVSSINTNDEGRDGHLRSADFFDVENHPTMSFISTKWEQEEGSDELTITGDLTIKGITHPVTFKGEIGGVQGDRAGVELTAKINRTNWGLNWNSALETGGVLVGEEITIVIDAQGTLQAPVDEDTEHFAPLES